jgi:putative PIN family toxin of toxin-antitoxin system
VKIVLDTNVFFSGVFFGGTPGIIVAAWQDNRFTLAVSLEILTEYERVANELAAKYRGVNPQPFLELLTIDVELYDCAPLGEQVCADPDDDKFLACAVASGSECVVSGDKLLLAVSGYRDVKVLSPREFVDRYLKTGT